MMWKVFLWPSLQKEISSQFFFYIHPPIGDNSFSKTYLKSMFSMFFFWYWSIIQTKLIQTSVTDDWNMYQKRKIVTTNVELITYIGNFVFDFSSLTV